MSCTVVQPGVVICTPNFDVERETEREFSAVWCRRCKRRRVHRLVILDSSEPSYYPPHPMLKCQCGQRRSW